jgi:hypothetical protein
MDLQKAPLVKLFLTLLIAYSFKVKSFPWRKIVMFALISLIILIFMYMYFMGLKGAPICKIFAGLFHRVFIGQIHPFFFWQLYQEHFGYLYGSSFPNPHGIFPFKHIRITVEVMYFAHPELYKLGIVGSMPTAFYANWWISFGPLMIPFSAMLLGFILRGCDILVATLANKYKHPVLVSLYVYLIYYFGKFAGTSFEGIIFDINLYALVILSVILWKVFYFSRNKIKKREKLFLLEQLHAYSNSYRSQQFQK